MAHHRTTRSTAALALALVAVAVPAADARPDGPAPQTSSLAGTTSPVDLRSPDARDAASGPVVDRRSPDARDAATRTVAGHGSLVAPAASTGGGTDWNDVAIAGGAAAGLLLIGSGTLVATRRRGTVRKSGTLAVGR
jgi:hypothetical protein